MIAMTIAARMGDVLEESPGASKIWTGSVVGPAASLAGAGAANADCKRKDIINRLIIGKFCTGHLNSLRSLGGWAQFSIDSRPVTSCTTGKTPGMHARCCND